MSDEKNELDRSLLWLEARAATEIAGAPIAPFGISPGRPATLILAHIATQDERIAELERLVEYVAFFCKKCGLRVFYEDGEWRHESYPEGVLDLDHKIVPEPEEYPS